MKVTLSVKKFVSNLDGYFLDRKINASCTELVIDGRLPSDIIKSFYFGGATDAQFVAANAIVGQPLSLTEAFLQLKSKGLEVTEENGVL